MSDSTTTTDEVVPPSASADSTSEQSGTTDTVETLKEKLAAQEQETARWKGRVKEENPKKETKESSEDYSDWRIDNRDRINLVKDQYESEMQELQDSGMKMSIALRNKALLLAEAAIGVKKPERTQPLPAGSVDRSGGAAPNMTKYDVQMGVKPETKKKWAAFVEG